jgi:DNA polymerase
VDARERLRLYLEQRRELGESELVLDALPVEDVMALLGAGRGARPSAARGPRTRASREPAAEAAATGPAAAPTAPREAMPPERAGAAEPPAPELPPSPTPRFDPASANRDWRAQLREQGLDQPVAGGSPPAAARPLASTPLASTPPADVPPNAPPSDALAPAASASHVPALPIDEAPPVPAWLAALQLPFGLAVGHTLRPPTGVASLEDVAAAVATCRLCPLGASALHPVPGEGNPEADFVCVGEAPGQTEDETGRPFVGAAGQLLTKILAAIQFRREDVFICNVLKHRPPGNRTPTPDEVRACRPFLEQQLALLRPRVILALGTSAAQALLGTTQSLGALRGKVHRHHGIPVIVTYHPAALLRNEAWKRPTWEDVQLARRIHDAARSASAS